MDALFVLLFVGAAVWLVSIYILIDWLKEKHPETYRALGEPRFHEYYSNQELKALIALLRFILKREHQSLNNPGLSRLCDFMQTLFIAYCLGFGALLISFVFGRH